MKRSLEEAAEADERSVTSYVVKTLKDDLARRGHWPPKSMDKQ